MTAQPSTLWPLEAITMFWSLFVEPGLEAPVMKNIYLLRRDSDIRHTVTLPWICVLLSIVTTPDREYFISLALTSRSNTRVISPNYIILLKGLNHVNEITIRTVGHKRSDAQRKTETPQHSPNSPGGHTRP